MTTLPTDKQYLLCGVGCCNITMFFTSEYCRGLAMHNECSCCLHECCYMEREPMSCFDKEESHIARIGCCCEAITLKYPRVCCQQTCHTCCLVTTCSIPTYPEAPFTFTCCFCICFPIWAHCYTIDQLKNQVQAQIVDRA